MLFQIAFRQVVLRPGQQFVEPCAIVGRQGEKQAIALSFRGGDLRASLGSITRPSGLTYACLNCSQAGHWQAAPTWPAASSSAESTAPQSTFIMVYSSSRLRRRRLMMRSMRHSTHASSTMLMAAKIASSIGWLESANQMRSNQGR